MTTEQILEAVKVMTVLELNDLVKAIEEEFGVTAAAPVAAAGAGAGLLKKSNQNSTLSLHLLETRKSKLSKQFVKLLALA